MYEKLKALDETWREIPADGGGEYSKLPDGKYHVYVDDVDVQESKNGRLQFVWFLKVLDGPFADRSIRKYNGLETEENLQFLKRDFNTCGVEVENISEIQAYFDQFLDIKLEVTLKTKTVNGAEYQNIYFNKRIELADGTSDIRDRVPF